MIGGALHDNDDAGVATILAIGDVGDDFGAECDLDGNADARTRPRTRKRKVMEAKYPYWSILQNRADICDW